jgi:hypothetical protein
VNNQKNITVEVHLTDNKVFKKLSIETNGNKNITLSDREITYSINRIRKKALNEIDKLNELKLTETDEIRLDKINKTLETLSKILEELHKIEGAKTMETIKMMNTMAQEAKNRKKGCN